jgi:sortase A
MRRNTQRLRDDRFKRRRFKRRCKARGPRLAAKILLATLITFTGWQWGHAGLVQAKAWLAPILISRAWTETRAHGINVKPWPWADTWPVARLSVPSLDIDHYVLAGTNGAALPFGPGHMTGSAEPGGKGTIVIAGHRDTHFGFLPRVQPGTRVTLETADGRRSSYVVAEKSLVDSRTEDLALRADVTELLLITCEPDNAFGTRGPWRLVVRATPD